MVALSYNFFPYYPWVTWLMLCAAVPPLVLICYRRRWQHMRGSFLVLTALVSLWAVATALDLYRDWRIVMREGGSWSDYTQLLAFVILGEWPRFVRWGGIVFGVATVVTTVLGLCLGRWAPVKLPEHAECPAPTHSVDG